MNYTALSKDQLEVLLESERAEYKQIVAQKFNVDIARGKPCTEQLDLAMDMLGMLSADSDYPKAYRNYGMLEGIPEMRELFGQMLGVSAQEVIVGGSSSLNLMYDTVQRAMQYGVMGNRPWNRYETIKFLCPVPGYDRHFALTQHFGIEMINIPMDDNGPNMDLIEHLVSIDDTIKGIWCVPKYSNPTGITYSDEVVTRLATMQTKAPDFRIFWDNAYCVHELTDTPDQLANIMEIAKQAGTQDRIYIFTSTSKITFAGSGVSCIAASAANIRDILSHMMYQTISYNKVWQYMHWLYLRDMDNVREIMRRQMQVIAPKFHTILNALQENFGQDNGIVSWTTPKGGYFISMDVYLGCAKRVAQLCKQAGLTITSAGATYPYGVDDADRNLRIAPTFTSDEDLEIATRILVCCVKIAALEQLAV